ncbi:phage tail sheath protein FI [Terriglobus roseus DSM 18391]|uniref:Phage tail sheath protein FI n=1 Tax=Terriglobus roseus (strain DSM 18391 / NRRL B-41598 / KBS 63) TaxID=926566 RepID=I3ZGP2_TERRK|nr:phage tail sheath subtilisin-like domain-containing protein [Terriglobus roseus]AFL88410.1 phage tail sheath protein FI [Terriglobus roseus DSM 18391]
MPATTTFPGVYLERLPSGVRSIAGVSTSVAAFLGEASRGTVGVATQIFNFTDFTREFGGLVSKYDLGYAVRQFFMNGGSEAWIVRVAANAVQASVPLTATGGATVLTLTALDAGDFGNGITVTVDWKTPSPGSTFNLTLATADGTSVESYSGLSMNSQDAKFVEKALASSQLVKATRAAGLAFPNPGTSTSGVVADTTAALTPPAGQPPRTDLRIVVDGLPVITISLNAAAVSGGIGAVASAIQTQVVGISTNPSLKNFTCKPNGSNDRLILTSGTTGENSSVMVLQGATRDAAAALKLGVASGGTEVDGTSALRPKPTPDPGVLRGAAITTATALDTLPKADTHQLQLVLDGGVADTVDLISGGLAAGADLKTKLQDMATRLQDAVQALRSTAAYTGFTAKVDDSGANPLLVLTSGTRGPGSSVSVLAAGADTFANTLGLLTGITATPGTTKALAGGSAQDVSPSTVYSSYVPSGTARQGLSALEEVQSFNLLIMPGITDSATLADAAAYCQARSAFLIADAPFDTDIQHMVTAISGPSLPKSINAAVYYPYFFISDPLNGGANRRMPPSGAIAGIYARTDTTRGVWKAPAGTDASVVGALGVEYTLTDSQNGALNPLGVNCIRSLPTFGIVSWGARTLRGSNAEANEYKYVPVSRTALFIEQSLYHGLQWVVFEPNDETLWSQIRLNVGAFMQGLFKQGAFAGVSADQAYFVECSSETTTSTDQSLGRVNVIVGFAPLRPAEFVIIQLQQIAGQAAS